MSYRSWTDIPENKALNQMPLEWKPGIDVGITLRDATCARCSATFKSYTRSRRVYCPTCRPIRQRANQDKANRRSAAKKKAERLAPLPPPPPTPKD